MDIKQLDELNNIILGCINNDQSSQGKLYDMFHARMMKTAMRYSLDAHQAEDIVSMSLLKCFQSISQYTFKGSFEGWLRRIVAYTAIDLIRADKKYIRNTAFTDDDESIWVNEGDPMYYDHLLQLIDTLPPKVKTVFNLSVMEGYPHKQIAHMLNMSEGTSKWYLSEGRKMLREKLK
jgi:RNA polymerase sigma factor (sigma-70 family)